MMTVYSDLRSYQWPQRCPHATLDALWLTASSKHYNPHSVCSHTYAKCRRMLCLHLRYPVAQHTSSMLDIDRATIQHSRLHAKYYMPTRVLALTSQDLTQNSQRNALYGISYRLRTTANNMIHPLAPSSKVKHITPRCTAIWQPETKSLETAPSKQLS